MNDQTPPDDRLTLLKQGKRSFLLSSGLYTWFIRTLRLMLPLLALGIVAMLFIWPEIEEPIATINDTDLVPKTIAQNEVVNPRFESRDSKNQPYTLTATRAVQSSENDQIVVLESPQADITLKDGTWLSVKAVKGVYQKQNEKLLLEEDVKLFHDDGYDMLFEKLWIDMKAQKAWSDRPLTGKGPAGTIAASGVNASMDGGILEFTGPATLILNESLKGI